MASLALQSLLKMDAGEALAILFDKDQNPTFKVNVKDNAQFLESI